MQDVYSYYAFISYKHEDLKYAKWLQKRLETYRLPAALQNEDVPVQAKPIFRDETDLTPGQPLRDTIKDKLRLSKYLIVICSKSLAKGSEYVDYEINSFIEMGRADRIIPVIIDGEPFAENPDDECFSNAIKQIPGEILAANSAKDGRYTASLKIIAALFQLDADDLIRRDERRRKRNRLFTAIAALLLFTVAFVALHTIFDLSFYSNSEEAIKAYSEKDYSAAADYAVKALRVPGRKDDKQEVEAILRGSVISDELKNTNTQFRMDFELEFPNESIALYGESKDGSKVAFSDLGKVWVYDFETGEKLATFDRNSEQEALDEFLDPVQDTEDLVDNTKGRKTESEKYTQSVGYYTFFVYDESGSIVCSFDADKTAEWVYSQDDSFIVVYSGDENNYTYIYSFEDDLCIQLEDKHMYVSNMWLTEKGRYLFIEYGTKHMGFNSRTDYIAIYDTASGSYITTFTDDRTLEISSNFVFSDIDSEVVYMFSASKATKYVFDDAVPDFSNSYITEKGSAVATSATGNYNIEISADGKRMLTKNGVYISKKDYSDSESVSFLNFFDIESGELLLSLNIEKTKFALSENFDICLTAKEKDVTVYNTDKSSVIYSHYCYSPVNSVVLNEDGSYAAYSTENGNIYILQRDADGYSQKGILFGSEFEGRTYISAMKGDRCVIYDEVQSYMYSIEADEKEKFTDTDLIQIEKHTYVGSILNAVTSRKILEDKFLELNSYADEYMFYDYETGEQYEFDFLILPWNYCDKNKLFVGIDCTGQEQVGSDLKVMRLENGNYEELYSLIPSFPVDEIYFDNTGEYLILVGQKGSEVFEAETGKEIFTIDRTIRIHDGVIYDVSEDLVLPEQLPVSGICSIREFKSKARALK